MTHKCTNCQEEQVYKNKVSWLNVRTKLKRDGYYYCRVCAGKIGRENSDKKPTGRPKGSKNNPKITAWNKGKTENINNIGTLSYEQKMKGIAKRNGFNSYEEYRDSLPEWKKYRIDVLRITKQQPLHLLENYDKRGVNGHPGVYTLDHKVSIRKGFNQGIPAEQIGHISNLEMLPWEQNITKGWK